MHRIILFLQFISLFHTCLSTCRAPNACGDCGICSWNATLTKEHCETNYLNKLFIPDPPICTLKDYCNLPPCVNGGQCKSTFGSYICLCTNLFYGKDCNLNKESSEEYTSELMLAYLPFDNVLKENTILVAIDKFGGGIFRLLYDNGARDIKYYYKNDFKKGFARDVCEKVIGYNKACTKMSNSKESFYMILKTVYPYVIEGKNLIEQRGEKENDLVVIGQFVESTILVYNYGKPYLTESFIHILDHRLLEKDNCIPTVLLENCGISDFDFSFTRNLKRTIRSITKPNKNCQNKKDVSLEWKIYNYGGNFDDESNLVKQELKVSELVIPKFSLNIGMYSVKLIATTTFVTKGGPPKIYSNFAFCLIQVKSLPLIAVIKGGKSKNVYSKDNITLDGSKSRDPNEPESSQSHLTFTWKCDKPDEFCKNFTSKESWYNVSGPFPIGESYNFSLVVMAEGLDPVSESQVISIVGQKTVEIEIICVQNCGDENVKANAKEIVYLKAEVEGHEGAGDLNYSWTYAENSGPEESVDLIREKGTPSNILIIIPNSLTEGKTYRFIVKVVGTESKSSITVAMNTSPDEGICTINPKIGIAGTTLFTVICQGFDNSSDITGLKYEFFEASSGVLLGFNYDGELRSVVLSQNNINVRISNSKGLYTDKNLLVEVNPLEATSENVQNLLNNMNKLVEYGDAAGTVRSISAISDLIVDVENKSDIFKKLLDILDKGNVNDFLDIKMYSLVLRKLVSQVNHVQPNGLDHHSCKVTGNLMKKMSKKVVGEIFNKFNASTEITARELQEVTRVFLETANIVLSSRDPVTLNKSAGTFEIFNAYLNYKKAASDIISSIENYSKSIGHQLLPSQREVIIQTNMSTIWVKIDTPERLSKMGQIPLSSNNSYMKISEKLVEALKDYSDVIRLEFAVLYKNPYWYDYNERYLESEVMSLRLFKLNSNVGFRIRILPEEIDIFLKLNKMRSQIISGSVTMPTLVATEDEKDSAVSVHKLDAPVSGGSGKVVFKFRNLKSNDTLKVLFLENIRPDYDSVSTNGYIITNASSTYASHFTNESPDVFLYIGLLPTSKVLPGVTIAYTFEMYSIQCQTRSGGEWNSKICKVGNLTRNDIIHCTCIHLSVFGGSILVAPNKIDPIKDISLFLTVLDNPAVFIIVMVLLLFYVLTLTWAYRKDKKDKIQKIVMVLDDNYPGEKFGYLITVFTGARFCAGTTANVGFEIFGKLATTRAHVFRCKNRKVLQKGSDDWFLIFTPKHLGELKTFHIWHDNSGPYPDWYCVKIVVHDLTYEKEYSFLVERWFCIGQYSKYVEAMLKPSLPKEIAHWNRLFSNNAFYYFRESHLWMSIFFCHPRTCIPRTHRVSIATSLIMCSLLTSIMFYGVGTDEGVDLPSYSIRTSDIIIGIESAVINTPITFLIVYFFRKSRVIQEVKMQPDEERLSEKVSKIKNVIKIDQNESVTESKPEEKGPLTKRVFRYLTQYVHNVVNPEPFIPVQISNVPTTTVIERPKFAIMAWILCHACIWLSAFFIMLYGLKLGKVTSELWITATLMGIGQGIFISTPIKLCIFSFVLALAFQKSYNVTTFEINISDAMRLDLVGNKEFLVNLIEIRSQPHYHPLPRFTLIDMHNRKMPTNLVWRPLIKLFIMSMFTLTLLMAAGNRWTAQFYLNNIHVENMLTEPVVAGGINYNAAKNISRFTEYLLGTLIPAVHTSKWYNEKPLSPKDDKDDVFLEWTHDVNTRLLSIPRIRQIRVKQASCNIPDIMKVLNIECNSALSDTTEDTIDYDTKWRHKFNISKSSEWIYRPRKKTEYLYGISGKSYHDGGYIAKFELSHKDTNIIVTKLIDNRWLDHLTRVIFVELTLYNINTKVISIATIIAEYHPSGAFFPGIEITSLPDSLILINEAWFLILGIFEVLFFFEIIFKISELGLTNFCLSCWNILELCIFSLTFVFLIIHIIQILSFPHLLESFQKRGQDEHLDISMITMYNRRMNFTLFILIILTTIWVLKYSMLGYKLKTFFYTLKLSFHLIKWLIMILLLFLVYVGGSVTSIFNSPIYINLNILLLYRMSYSGISSEENVLQQKQIKILYCFTCATGYVFFSIIITYYYRLGKYYKYDSKYLNIHSNIIKNKLKSLKHKNSLKGFRLRGGSDKLDNETNLSTFCKSEKNVPLDLHKVRLQLMTNNVSNFLKNQNKFAITHRISKHRIIGNVLFKDRDLFHKEILRHNFISADAQTYKISEKLPYNNITSQDNSYYFDRIIFKLDCIIDKLDDICDSEFQPL